MYQVYKHFTGCFLPTVFLEKKNNISLANYIQELDSQLEKFIYSRIHKYIHKRTEHFFVVHSPAVHSPAVHSPAEGSPQGHSPEVGSPLEGTRGMALHGRVLPHCLKSYFFWLAVSKCSVIYHWHVCDRSQRSGASHVRVRLGSYSGWHRLQ